MTSLRGLRAFYLASISMIVVSIFIDAIGSPQTYQTDVIPAPVSRSTSWCTSGSRCRTTPY